MKNDPGFKWFLFTGGRKFDDARQVDMVMRKLSRKYGKHGGRFVTIAGAAPGLDTLVLQWAHEHYMPYLCVQAAWDMYDHEAGNIRNRWMATMRRPDRCFAFAGGTGTKDMVEVCHQMGIPVTKIKPAKPYNA